MNWLAFAETVVTLFVIVDPLGTVPVFVALTAEQTPSQRRWTAVQSAAVAGSLIAVFALFGASCWPTFGRERNRAPTRAQHLPQKLVCDWKRFSTDTIVAHEQPAA
jgi:hypothetical protein